MTAASESLPPLDYQTPGAGETGNGWCWRRHFWGGCSMGWRWAFSQIARPVLANLLHDLPKDQLAAKIKEWNVIIDALFLFGAALGGLVFGWLGIRLGRVKAMSMSILVYSGFTGLLYFVQTPGQIGILRFVAAIGMGGNGAGGCAGDGGVGCATSADPGGIDRGGVERGFCAGGRGRRIFSGDRIELAWVVLAGAVPAAITFFIQIFVPESHRWKEAQKIAPTRPLAELFSNGKLTRTALLAICFASIALLGTWGAVQKIPAWVDLDFKAGASAKAYCQITSGAGAIFGCLFAPMLAAVLNRRTAYFLLCMGSLICCQALFWGFTSYSPMFLVMTFLVGGVTAAFYGWLPLYLPELFPTRVRATAQGIAYNFGRIFAAVGSIILSSMSVNYAKMGVTVSLIYVVGMLVIWLRRKRRGGGCRSEACAREMCRAFFTFCFAFATLGVPCPRRC